MNSLPCCFDIGDYDYGCARWSRICVSKMRARLPVFAALAVADTHALHRSHDVRRQNNDLVPDRQMSVA